MRRLTHFLAFTQMLLLCNQVVAQQVTLSGRVRVASRVDSRPQSGRVVVWLVPLGRRTEVKPFTTGPLHLIQHNKSFEPHLLVVPVGSVVEFPNHDPFFHNVFSLFEGKRFDLGLYEAGSSRNVSFDRPGVSYIFCNIHAEMSAVVIALETPYYSISTLRGELVIPNVPVGRYEMHVWYETALPENLKNLTREIEVTEGSSTLGMLEVPTLAPTGAHKNKYGMDYEPPDPNTPGYKNR